ncbi:hypothetical protein EG329_003385 [Mollisiaceae sp. DMI_Dod_QoI]|nr:hypothetical protein EG329_003385 [Helotiales sp. DMI_Dod_QoI]
MAQVVNTKPYEYQALEGHEPIRLIELQPSSSLTATVQCKLIPKTLKQVRDDIVTPYIALSYVWGNPNDTTSIFVDDSTLQITKTLDCALRHVRDEERVICVWADGICISQCDNVEKAQQVALMGEIYSIADHTIIYLGPAITTSEHVLCRISTSCESDDYSSVYTDLALIHGINEILSNPWFSRIWILQELVLSQDPRIQWGRSRCSWRALSQMSHFLANARLMPEIHEIKIGVEETGVHEGTDPLPIPRHGDAVTSRPYNLKRTYQSSSFRNPASNFFHLMCSYT